MFEFKHVLEITRQAKEVFLGHNADASRTIPLHCNITTGSTSTQRVNRNEVLLIAPMNSDVKIDDYFTFNGEQYIVYNIRTIYERFGHDEIWGRTRAE